MMSCSRIAKKVEIPFCKNELTLLQAEDSITHLRLDYSLGSDSLRTWILQRLDTFNCLERQFFGLEIDNRIILKSIVEQSCPEVRCYSIPYSRLSMNKEGLLLFEGEFLQIDSLSNKVITSFKEHYARDERFGLSMKWPNGISNSPVNLIFLEVTKGYILLANEYAMQKFSKTICALNSDQLMDLKKEFPFNWLIIKKTSMPPPPSSLRE